MIIKYKYGKNFRAVCKTARSNDSSGARVNIKNSKKKQFKKEEEGNIERQKTKGKKKERKNPDCFAVSQGGGGGIVLTLIELLSNIALDQSAPEKSVRYCKNECY